MRQARKEARMTGNGYEFSRKTKTLATGRAREETARDRHKPDMGMGKQQKGGREERRMGAGMKNDRRGKREARARRGKERRGRRRRYRSE